MEDLEKRLSKLKNVLSHDVFYPKGYIDIVFEDAESMEKASHLLCEAGWVSADIISFTGEEVLKIYNQTQENYSVWEKFVASLKGKYFILAYAGSVKKAIKTHDVVISSKPIAIFGYAPLFIVKMNLNSSLISTS